MGGADRMLLSSKVCKKTEVQKRRQPHSRPPFTLSQVKKAIPPHCFHRSLVRSSSYLVVDLTLSFLFYYIATAFFHRLPHPLPYLAWPTYWALQGCLLPGFWVIGHECGHHAFSDYRWLNHSVGLVLHTALLWPYFSGRISHHKHHSNTGSIERDELFLPKPYSETSWHLKHLNNPPGRFLTLAATLLLGYPLYLTFNVSGRNYGRFASHYDPFSPIFSEHERISVFVSDLAILAATFGLYKLAAWKGLTWLVCVYGVPMMVFYALMVLLTYLQHTHSSLPYYDSSEWEWLRGAFVTVDRDWGILNRVFHHITDTHVVHHLFPAIPHYHAVEATVAARPVLGDYYKFDDTPILRALWREARECLYVELDRGQGVYWYRNCN